MVPWCKTGGNVVLNPKKRARKGGNPVMTCDITLSATSRKSTSITNRPDAQATAAIVAAATTKPVAQLHSPTKSIRECCYGVF